MQSLRHDANVYFRAPTSVVEQAARVARERNMTFSEFLRHAVRREIGRETIDA